MKYSLEELEKLQSIEKDILKVVSSLCIKNEIEFFAAEGTLLGAVRHNDIIPWDDDIDIGMTRPNYERFIEIASRELPSDYVLQHFSVDNKSPTYYAKVRKRNTEFVEDYTTHLKICHGIFIDVFPYDIIPISDFKAKKMSKIASIKNQLFVSRLLWRASGLHGKGKKALNSFVRGVLHVFLLPIPRRWLFSDVDKFLKSFSDEKPRRYAYQGKMKTVITEQELYPLRKVKFGDILIPCFNKSEDFLTRRYGEYMKYPPEASRIGHAPVRLSFDKDE